MVYNLKHVEDDDDDVEDEDRKRKKISLDRLDKLIKKLENYSPQTNLIKLISNYTCIKRLDAKLDSNRFLISFKNGTYDLKNHTFRKGSPDDFLSKTLNVNYNEELTFDDDRVLNILSFLKKIFPDPKLLEYFLLQISEVFYGGNRDKIIMVWTGKGNNGKTVLQSLFEKTFASLAIKIPASAVTSETKAGGCFPELARLEGGIRWAVIDEFEKDVPLNAGKLKLLSGNDSLYARDCFEKGKKLREIKPFFNLILICNTIPKVKNGDKAFFKRLKVIPFESEFRDDIHEDHPDKLQFMEDTNISFKIEEDVDFSEAFIWYLIEMYKIKSSPGFKIKIPLKVNEATTKYKAQCDTIASFIKESFDVDEESIIKVSEYYHYFRLWYTHEYSTTKGMVTNSEFCQLFIENTNGDEKTGRVKGYRYKEYDETDSGV
jgi:P4 family phage/plasmid primase-like protien